MNEFMEQALDSAAASAPVWLQDWQVDGRGRWERSVIPTRKTENWKYTGLQSLRQAFAAPAIAELGLSGAGVDVPELGDGYRLEAKFVLWHEENVLQVPASSLFRRGNGWAVFVVEDQRAQLREVKVGQRNGLAAQISMGLEEGDTVINHPSDAVEDGVRVVSRSHR